MTRTRSRLGLIAIWMLCLAPLSIAQPEEADEAPAQEKKTGLIHKIHAASPGYTLFAPLQSKKTYLVDIDGNVVKTWESELGPGNSAYLLPNGHLVRCAREPENPVFQGGGQGGRIQELDWDGQLVWDWVYSDEHQMQHHDIEVLPNGNLLVIAWERKSASEALAAGRNPDTLGARELWPDKIVEIRAKPPTDAEVVWEWHSWDHLIQDFDESKANYGDPSAHPELIDVNFTSAGGRRGGPGGRQGRGPDGPPDVDDETQERLRALGYLGGDRDRDRQVRSADWMHTNAIAYNAELDQIAISLRNFSEIWIIDHSTTTEQAASHEGGRWGKGGDLLYRWGNPAAYKAGGEEQRQLFGQHDIRWIPKGYPGEGQLLVFNNGDGRGWSSVDQFAPPMGSKGNYLRTTGQKHWGPEYPVWTYVADEKEDFFSSHISGADRLPNGNTLICDGQAGRIFEVTGKGTVVWDYVNGFGGDVSMGGRGGRGRGGRGGRGPGGPMGKTALFRATRYAPDYPGLKALQKEDDAGR